MTCENCAALEAEIKRLRKKYRREHKNLKAARTNLKHHAIGIGLMKGTFDDIIAKAEQFTPRRKKNLNKTE